MSFDGLAANTSGWSTGPKARGTGSIGCAARIQHSLPIGRYAMATAEHREPYESRGSRTVVCPAKAGMFSRRQTCRGRSQSPVVWIAEVMETETLKPIDKVSPGEATSHRAVTTVNALWPRK